MKKQYNIPEIAVECLTLDDTLCASSEEQDESTLRESKSVSIFFDL